MKITCRGFPWQKTTDHWANRLDGTNNKTHGWNPLKVKGMGRFGGGWAICFGVQISSSFKEWIFSLIIGQIRVSFYNDKKAIKTQEKK